MEFSLNRISFIMLSSLYGISSPLNSFAQTVNVGETVQGTVLTSGMESQVIYGTAKDTTIYSGGGQDVMAGGESINVILSGGTQFVRSGTVIGAIIGTDGVQEGYQQSKGESKLYNTTINEGGIQTVYDNAYVDNTIINGGTQYLNGGDASNTRIIKGIQRASNYTINDMNITGTEIFSGGTQSLSGNTTYDSFTYAKDTVINAGGIQKLYSNSVTDNTIIHTDGVQEMSSNPQVPSQAPMAKNTVIDGGIQYVQGNGSSALDTIIKNNGRQTVGNEASAYDTVIESGEQFVFQGGTTARTVITGGIQTLQDINLSYPTPLLTKVTNTTINGGTQIVGREVNVVDTVINSGSQILTGNNSSSDNTIINGGYQLVNYGSKIKNTILNGGQSFLRNGAKSIGNLEVNLNGLLSMETGSSAENINIDKGFVDIIDSHSADDSSVIVENLNMNNGVVNFQNSTNYSYPRLNIGSLTGVGKFIYNTSIADRHGNFVTINEGHGNFDIEVNDTGREVADGDNLSLNLVQVVSGDAVFNLTNKNGNTVNSIDGGTFMYSLYNEQDKDELTGNIWYLGLTSESGTEQPEPGNPGPEQPEPGNPGTEQPEPGNPGTEQPEPGNPGTEQPEPGNPGIEQPEPGNPGLPVPSVKPKTTPSTDAILNMASASLGILNNELDSWRVYRGIWDNENKKGDQLWAHYLGNKTINTTSNGSGYHLQQYGLELGYDIKSNFDSGDLVFGGLVSYSQNSVKHNRGGNSNIDVYGVGLYAAWIDSNNYYVDGIIKYNTISNNLIASMSNGQNTRGKWSQRGLSASFETGKNFIYDDVVQITPYIRGSMFRTSSSDVKLDNGMSANTGIGSSVKLENGIKLQSLLKFSSSEFKPYIKVSMVTEFSESNKVLINDKYSFDNNSNGISGKYAVGTSLKVGSNTYAYSEFSYVKGKHNESPAQGVIGVTINF
jgi:outer membrane autotransporter protein